MTGARERWRELVAAQPRAPAAEALIGKTADGLPVLPLYTRQDGWALGLGSGLPGAAPFTRGATAVAAQRGWLIRQRVAHPEPAAAGAALAEELGQGADAVTLGADHSLAAGGMVPDGTVLLDLADLHDAFASLEIELLAGLTLDARGDTTATAALLLAWAEGQRPDPASFRPALNADPIGAALTGRSALDPALALAAGMARHLAEAWPGATALLADGRPWHAAGATEAQELAAVVASGLAYLRLLEGAGLSVEAAAGQIAFTLAVDADLFSSVAKLRACRRLWGRVLAGCDAAPAAATLRVHAETGSRMYAARDPWNNIVRAATACLAATAGGADSIGVLPFDHALGLPSPLARRLARNTQLVLRHESNLHRVIDPAGGAWFVESLTDGLARAAWALVQRIEAAGGMLAAVRVGLPQGWAAESWAARARNAATRAEALVGVSAFAELGQLPVEPEPFDATALVARTQARLADAATAASFPELLALARAGRTLAPAPVTANGITPLPTHRLGEAFEALCRRGDLALARDGRRPHVLLVALGPLVEHGTRCSFMTDLLAAGGIEAVMSRPISDPAAAFRDSGTSIAILCSSDAVYAALAIPAATALRAAGCGLLCLAGKPAGLDAAAIDLFVRAGDDMVEFLTGLHDRLGTPAAAGQEGGR